MKKQNFKTAFSLAGTVIGAGMVTGVEVREYFGAGPLVPILIIFTVALMAAMLWVILTFCIQEEIKDLQGFCDRLLVKHANILKWAVMLGSIAISSAMLSGIGSLFDELELLPKIIASLLFALVGSLCALTGVKGLSSVNYIVIPIILAFAGVLLVHYGPAVSQNAVMPFAFMPYAAYNVSLAIPLCVSISVEKTDKKGIRYALGMFAVLCTMVIMLVYLLVGNAPANSVLPVLYLAAAISPLASGFYAVSLSGAVMTTYISGMFAFNQTKWRLTVATTAAFLLSLLPLESIVKFIYPISGITGIICVLRILYLKKNRKKT